MIRAASAYATPSICSFSSANLLIAFLFLVTHSFPLFGSGAPLILGRIPWDPGTPTDIEDPSIIQAGDYAAAAKLATGEWRIWGNAEVVDRIPSLVNAHMVKVFTRTGNAEFVAVLYNDGSVSISTNDPRAEVATGVLDIAFTIDQGDGAAGVAIRTYGTLQQWGTMAQPPPQLTNAVSVVGGVHHFVVLTREGQVHAWGDNSSGQCDVPTNVSNVTQLVAGDAFTAALTSDGKVITWGGFRFRNWS